MYKNLKLMIVEHWGAIILTIGIIISLYFVLTEVILTTSETTETVVALYNVIDNSTADIFDNKIVQGSQVLTTIKKYYNDEDAIILLFNKASDYNSNAYKFWVTGRGGKYGQNTNYESNIISINYNDITSILIKDTSINNKYTKIKLSDYSDSSKKSYINNGTKYKSVLIKCNGYTLGIAFFAI